MEEAQKKRSNEGKRARALSRLVTIAGFLLLAIGLSLLAGCATAGKGKVEPPEPTPTLAAQPSPPCRQDPLWCTLPMGVKGL